MTPVKSVLNWFHISRSYYLNVKPSPASLMWALAYGFATTVASSVFFVYPSMGFGVFGMRSPEGIRAPLYSLANHLFFGVGMAVAVALA